MRRWLYSLGPCGLVLLFSCIDQTDYQIEEVGLNPTLAIPLINGELSVSDLLDGADSTHVKVYPDGLIYLSYEDQLRSQDIRELFAVPDKTVNVSFVLPGATLPPVGQDIKSDSITRIVDLVMSPEMIDEIALRSGQIAFVTTLLPGSSQLDYEIRLSLPGFKSRTTNQPLSAVAKGSGTINLSDYTMYIDDNKFTLKVVLVLKKRTSSVVVSPGTSVNISLAFRSMQFSYLKGFLGTQTASLDADEIELGFFGDLFEGAQVSLAQPKVSLSVTNENGVPCKVDFKKLEARKEGATPMPVLLSPANPVSLAYPTTIGQSATTTVTITNVKELLNYAPTSLYYQADAIINSGLTSGVNFVLDTSQLDVSMSVEVPLYGSATNISLRDTLDVDLSNQDDSQISSASLKLKIINELPLDGAVQFYLLDNNYVPIDELLLSSQTTILRGSKVDAAGELLEPGLYDNVIELSQDKIDQVFKARHIIIAAVLQTSRNSAGGVQDVKFKSTYKLQVEAGLLASLKLRLK